MLLVQSSYGITRTFPKFERYGLSSQMNRCAVSIPSNIAEGSSKSTDKHFSQFLESSLGSAFEWETQLIIAYQAGYVKKDSFKDFEIKIQRLQKMISRFRRSLNN